MPDITIPFYSLQSQHDEIRAEVLKTFQETYDSNWFLLGEKLKNFEQAYADFSQTKWCAGVANGLDAIYLSLRALDIGPGDEVIVPSHTYIATWLAVTMTGAKPVPVEPDLRTFNIDVNLIESALSKRTKAIIPVHLYGQACEMQAIMAIAEKNRIAVVEDNAQAQGAQNYKRKTGSFGIINATSFYPGKNLGALGDGGAVTTDNTDLYNKVCELRNYGSSVKYFNNVMGVNSRLDEIHAAVLSVKLRYLNEWNAGRQKAASYYLDALSRVGDIILPETAAGSTHVYHLFVIRTEQRDELSKYLAENGIGTVIHYPIPPHLQQAYQHMNYRKGDFPKSEKIASSCLSLPLWPSIPASSIHKVVEVIRRFYDRKKPSI